MQHNSTKCAQCKSTEYINQSSIASVSPLSISLYMTLVVFELRCLQHLDFLIIVVDFCFLLSPVSFWYGIGIGRSKWSYAPFGGVLCLSHLSPVSCSSPVHVTSPVHLHHFNVVMPPVLQFSSSPVVPFSSSVLQLSHFPVQFSGSPIFQVSSSPVLQFSSSPVLCS